MEKYINEHGQVGVLISSGFGAGWSTWNDDYGMDLALDKRIIEKFIHLSENVEDYSQAKKEMEEFLTSIGYEKVYCGGLEGLYLAFVDKGTPIRIDEYDGAETLEEGYNDYTTL